MKYIVSWYETNRMLATNCCQTFTNKRKALEYYAERQKTKKDINGYKIRNVCLSVEKNPNMDIVDISMDRQPWYDWVEFKLANGKRGYGKVKIHKNLIINEWAQAVRQVLCEKYGYNINYIPTLTEREIKKSEINFDKRCGAFK